MHANVVCKPTVAQAPMQPSRSDKAMPPVGGSATSAATSKTICCTRHCPAEMRRSHWSIDQFVVAKKLGGGYASTVHLAICKATGMQVAIKVYHRCKLSQLNNYQVHREIRIHACLDHRNVLQLFAAFEDDVGVYLVTEYASRGDVFGELDRRGGSMTEADAVRQVLAPFLSALDYLHTLHIIHRDIKPENLLFTAAGVLKVADFGLSIDITQERPVTRVGTLDYMAPEVVICPDKVHPSDHKEKVHLHYTYLVDAWAVGVLAYELTVGRAPFDAGHKRGTIDNILHATPRYPAWVSDSARHFVGWSLTKDAAKRPGIQQLAEHPWIHQHAGAPAHTKLVNPGRAMSCHNLGVQPVQTPQSPQHRHKLDSSSDVRLTHLQEEEEQDVFVSAHGEGFHADAAAAAKAAAAAALGGKQPLPGGAVVINAGPGSTAASSPFGGASQSPERGGGGSGSPGSMLGAAADKLRAFVHRCQSANDLDGLKAFMMSQPPEPSNACFEPGGRFYSPSSGAQQQQQQDAKAAAAAAAAGGKGSAHDSATSVSSQSHGSSSSSKPADLPRPSPCSLQQQQHVLKPLATPAAAACFGGASGRPLQLIKLPQPGSSSRLDSCRSMQESPTDFAAAAAAAGIRGVGGSAYSNDVDLIMSPGSATPAGQQGGSPMAVSPAGALIRTTSAGTNADQPPRPFSTASTESCCSSSCDNAARDGSSICSSHSWGFGGHAADLEQQQPMQHSAGEMLPPRPHSPPRVGGANAAAVAKAAPAPAAAASHMQQQHNSSRLGVAAGPSAYSGDLHQLMQVCASSMPSGGGSLGEAAGAALAASKQALVSLSAECGGSALLGDDQVQQEQQAAALTINSCFGFLKGSRAALF